MKVLIIGVNYNSDDSALRFVDSLSSIIATSGINTAFVLVDNTERSSSQVFFKHVQAINPSVICIKSPVNVGYFGGVRFGLEEYLKTNILPDWVIVSNVDLEFINSNFLSHLHNVSQIEKLGVVAPSIWSESRKHDWNPMIFVRPSKLKMHFYKVLFRNYYVFTLHQLLSKLKSLINRSIMLGIKFLTTQKKKKKVVSWQNIYAPHGSCIIFSKLYFERGGNLNYPQFLFGEEIFVAETVRHIGLRVIYYPALKVHSYDRASTGRKLFRPRKIASYCYESAVFIADKYFI